MKIGISSKWSELAKNWLGDVSGQGLHCHWCKFMDNETCEGEVYCSNKKSKFCDGDRIRTWDGLGCAEECECFELDDYYKSDANF